VTSTGRLTSAAQPRQSGNFGEGKDTVVVLDEHPLRGPGYHLHNTLSDALLLLRGRPLIRNLARLVVKRNPRP
jgi:hypothetical protein